jgi:hypothetical protein
MFARAIGESIFTQAATIASLHNFIRDAVKYHFEDRDWGFVSHKNWAEHILYARRHNV